VDPVLDFDADPDQTFHSNVDPDPALKPILIRITEEHRYCHTVSAFVTFTPLKVDPLSDILIFRIRKIRKKRRNARKSGCNITNTDRVVKTFSKLIVTQVDESNLLVWQGLLVPENPPYNKGAFLIDIIFPAEYPFKPPKVREHLSLPAENVTLETFFFSLGAASRQ
jgi:hypothetical protein